MSKLAEWIPKLRLYSGLVLMAYLCTHLLNTSLGIISLELMEAGLLVARFIWNADGLGLILKVAIFVHVGIVLYQFINRSSPRMNRGELPRFVLGLLIPFALIAHYWGSHVLPGDHGYKPEYASAVYSMFNPMLVPIMISLIIIAWLHGCLGIHYWLRYKPWYRRFLAIAVVPAVALPVLSIAGFIAAGREVNERAREPAISGEYLKHKGAKTYAEMMAGNRERGNISGMYYTGFLALIFAIFATRRWLRKRRRSVRVKYPDGTEVLIYPGASILDASRLAGIPHASVCGGRGRCSTCRVHITTGAENIPDPTADERRVLTRVGVSPNVRLACCCYPSGTVHIHPLMQADAARASDAHRSDDGFAYGRDTDIAILFADLRGFTTFSEHKLPYDVVFVLNQYFQLMGQAIESEGGHVDKFIGDGIMALFGLTSGLENGCREALRAARRMEEGLAELNLRLKHDQPEPMNMGIGIHCGHVIAGRMGYGKTTGLTAIGDAVNTASRLESSTREYGCRLIVSEDVIRTAGMDPVGVMHEISVRGRTRPLKIYAVNNIAEIQEGRRKSP